MKFPVLAFAGMLAALLACGTDATEILTNERAATCSIAGALETADQCECLGATVRPNPAHETECQQGETELGRFSFGVEGAVCCWRD